MNPPAADPASLSAQADALRARIAARAPKLAAAHARVTETKDALTEAEALYRATPAGLAESLRQIERALLTRQPARTIRALQRVHIAAELEASDEYRIRADRWGRRAHDGPLMACPIGANGQFADWILHLHITGTYRHDPAAGEPTVVARLTRPLPGGRTARTSITLPTHLIGREGLTLHTIVTTAYQDPATAGRFDRWLGEHAPHVAAATRSDPPTF